MFTPNLFGIVCVRQTTTLFIREQGFRYKNRLMKWSPNRTRAKEDVNELESSIIPLLEKEGWMRDQENIAKQP
jgi:hypothetical protein